ncbi:enkurin [Agrilus planipennis]|uniref:Enkurin n=1 Tax=Agrilus planipennis TaxID=224129 RepID=A0A1W4XIH3_AGRPL|nr:enkurin [Agrilus planipennis]
MSVIKITHHDENIYDIRQKEATFYKKSPRYISRYTNLVAKDYKKSRCKPHADMGLAHYPPPDPREFLKKHSVKPKPLKCPKQLGRIWKKESPPPKEFSCVPTVKECLEEERRRKEKIPAPKNYIRVNIKKAIGAKPKEPEKNIVDTRVGHKQNIDSGVEPKFIYGEEFGKIPSYLEQLMEERILERQSKNDVSGTEQPKCKYITREEREELLAGLKKNWEELQKQYQGLPILTDTIPKMNRKSKMEADLKQLEKDIVMIERHPYIYVYDDDDLN